MSDRVFLLKRVVERAPTFSSIPSYPTYTPIKESEGQYAADKLKIILAKIRGLVAYTKIAASRTMF